MPNNNKDDSPEARETEAAMKAWRKAMLKLGTIFDNEHIDNFYRSDPVVRKGIRVYESDQPGGFSIYGADEAAAKYKRSYPEIFNDRPVTGGTPPSEVRPQTGLDQIREIQRATQPGSRGKARHPLAQAWLAANASKNKRM